MASSWWEIRVLCDPSLEESIFWRLNKFGCSGTARSVKGQSYLICAYIPQIKTQLLDIAALSLWLRQDALICEISPPVTRWRLIDEEDWSSSWKQHWQPQEIGDSLLVCPAWLTPPADSDRVILRLDPGIAFGTGTHETTQLCLESLEMRLSFQEQKQVIADIGCGSGILSIAALLLGASQVYAVDIDPLAVQATRSNCVLNQLSDSALVVSEGSIQELLTLVTDGVDGFLCNIQAEVIIDLIPYFNKLAKPQAWGILSGILLEQAKPISDTLQEYNWVVGAFWKRGDWCCLNIRRES